jgi:hypothetical protein
MKFLIIKDRRRRIIYNMYENRRNILHAIVENRTLSPKIRAKAY